MRALLDTHAFLWAAADDPRLSARAREVIEDGTNEIVFSAASAYEIVWKAERGRLELPEPAESYVLDRLDRLAFEGLAVNVRHAVRAAALPHHHADPWDRLLIAQARDEGIPLITVDSMIARYEVEVLW